MSDVTFNEPQYNRSSGRSGTSAMSRMIIKTGLAKTERGAQTVLLVIALVAAVLAVIVYLDSHSSTPVATPASLNASAGNP